MPLAVVGQTAIDSPAGADVVVVTAVVVVVVLFAREDDVVVELTDVVVLGVVDLLLLPHAATMIANDASTDSAPRRVRTVMPRMYVQPTATGQGRSSQ